MVPSPSHRLNTTCRAAVLLWTVALVCGLNCPLRASPAQDELLRLVPEDVAFCLTVQNLRDHWADLAGSPFIVQLLKSPLGQALEGSPELQKLSRLDATLQKQFGLNWSSLRDEVLGDAVVLAYKPGPPGKPDQEQGLILLRARNARTLADAITRFNDTMKKAGALKELTECDHNGVKYFRRVDAKETSYFYLRGPMLVFSGQEAMLLRAIDADRALATNEPASLTVRLKQLGVDSGFLTLYVNPRAFDTALAARLGQARPAETALQQSLTAYWHALEGLAVSLKLEREASLVVAVRTDHKKLPPPAQRFFAQAGRPSALWSVFPEQPLLAWAGRIDAASLAMALSDFLPPERRQSFHEDLNRTLAAFQGGDFVKDVLPYLGPDLGFCLMAPAPQDKSWVPQGLFAIRVGRGDETAPVDQKVLSALQFLVQFAILGHNHQNPTKPIVLRKMVVDRREIHYLVGDNAFPSGVQPAFSMNNGYLFLANAPETIRRCAVPPAAPGPVANGPVPIIRISASGWRAFLTQRQGDIVRALSAGNEMTADEATQKLKRIVGVLEFLERIELLQQRGLDHVTFRLVLQPAQSLKK